MASSVNFENHIKRFIESMRGVQRVLYIGTDIDMKKYPVLAGLSWRCIYTASQDENLGEAFSLTNDRQIKSICSKDAYDKAGNKLDRKNPLLIYLNGYSSPDTESDDLDAEIERDENRSALRDTLGLLLKSELMVELTVVGYNPADERELSPKSSIRLLTH